jgi:hypothetical protein
VGMKVYNLDSVNFKCFMKTWNEALKWSWRSYLEKNVVVESLCYKSSMTLVTRSFMKAKQIPLLANVCANED